MEKRNEKGRYEGVEGWGRGGEGVNERNHNRMIEVVCEGRRFGDRTNENARDWLWVVLVAWAAKSISYLLARTLVATAHSSPMAEITVTCKSTQHVPVSHLKPAAPPPPG